MTAPEVEALYQQYVLPTYRQVPLCLVKGKGARVWDIHGREYLDFFPGWAVSGLGHCHPDVIHALKHQAGKIMHVSNNFLSVPQARLAETIVRHAFPGKMFFCNSGAEANEAAIKYARRFGQPEGRFEMITMTGSFHGRTLAALSATGQDKLQEGFGPPVEGFRYAHLNDPDSVKKLVNERTVAILVEPVQGEGGIRVAKAEFLKELRALADERNLLLIFDEVQTGMGRTGTMFAFQQLGVTPDLMTLAKSLGNGVPIGALLVAERHAGLLGPGTHGSTFGGSPLVASAALAVFKAIRKHKLLARAQAMGRLLRNGLETLKEKCPNLVKEVRGLGLMLGAELRVPGAPVADRCRENGLLINCTQECVLRIMPPLVVTTRQIEKALSILDGSLEGIAR